MFFAISFQLSNSISLNVKKKYVKLIILSKRSWRVRQCETSRPPWDIGSCALAADMYPISNIQDDPHRITLTSLFKIKIQAKYKIFTEYFISILSESGTIQFFA